MSKTPIFARIRLAAGGNDRQKDLKEPFLTPGGTLHTDLKYEKSKLKVRWLMLSLTSMLMMGSYYCYDNPAALYKNLQARFYFEDKFDYYFDLLYSVYSLPNIVLPMAGWLLVDRLGVNFALNLFACAILIGQVRTDWGIAGPVAPSRSRVPPLRRTPCARRDLPLLARLSPLASALAFGARLPRSHDYHLTGSLARPAVHRGDGTRARWETRSSSSYLEASPSRHRDAILFTGLPSYLV